MSQDQSAGPVVHSFFADHLITVKGVLVRTVSGRAQGVQFAERRWRGGVPA
jgi:hypothetical protein